MGFLFVCFSSHFVSVATLVSTCPCLQNSLGCAVGRLFVSLFPNPSKDRNQGNLIVQVC